MVNEVPPKRAKQSLHDKLIFARVATERQKRKAHHARRLLREIDDAFNVGDIALARRLAADHAQIIELAVFGRVRDDE